MNNLTATGFKRRYAFWFFIITSFILTLLSGIINISDSALQGYYTFCIFGLTLVVGSKANDTNQKFKKERGIKNE